MDLSERIEALGKLGDYLKDTLEGDGLIPDPALEKALIKAEELNPWFIRDFTHHALLEVSNLLDRDILKEWTGRYPLRIFERAEPLSIGTVMAGNIPLVGFHDFLCILLTGNRFKGKLSARDEILLPFLANKLIDFEPDLKTHIHFAGSLIGDIDAIIATGSNNSFRYFEYYFGKYPHIFRKNRNGVAVISGAENPGELSALARDIFLYFGLGCRNVAKLYVPDPYDFDALFRGMEAFSYLADHHKYANNYLYHRSVYLMNGQEHLDNGFLLLKPDKAISSPVGALYYEQYRHPQELVSEITAQAEQVQCIAGGVVEGLTTVPFGKTQHPGPWDYADNVDTLNFLSNL